METTIEKGQESRHVSAATPVLRYNNPSRQYHWCESVLHSGIAHPQNQGATLNRRGNLLPLVGTTKLGKKPDMRGISSHRPLFWWTSVTRCQKQWLFSASSGALWKPCEIVMTPPKIQETQPFHKDPDCCRSVFWSDVQNAFLTWTTSPYSLDE